MAFRYLVRFLGYPLIIHSTIESLLTNFLKLSRFPVLGQSSFFVYDLLIALVMDWYKILEKL